MTIKIVSVRLDPELIAKARDGLKLAGYKVEELQAVSNVVQLAFLAGLVELSPDVTAPASKESLAWIGSRSGSGPGRSAGSSQQ